MNIDEQVQRAAHCLRSADALLICAGAGMGVDSGLPDFRGTQGFWKAYPKIGKLGLSFAEMANPTWFRTDPRLAWAFYGHRLNLYRRTVPHDGFGQLLVWARSKPASWFVFTSNVDGHFQKAGFDSDRIVECHGSIHHFQCSAPCCDHVWDANLQEVRVDEDAFRALDPLPKCPTCDALARPNILMFSDWCWISHRSDAQHQRFEQWLQSVERASAKLAIVELGAGTAIATVRHLSESIAARFGACLVRINSQQPAVPTGQIALPLGAAEALRQISRVL